MDNNLGVNIDKQEGAIALFRYIKELNQIKRSSQLDYTKHDWYCDLISLEDDQENIQINYRDRTEDDELEEKTVNDAILVTIKKPIVEECPKPNGLFIDWLKADWYKPTEDVAVYDVLPEAYKQESEQTVDSEERFEDNQNRVQAFKIWKTQRKKWVERNKIALKTKMVFDGLYEVYYDLKRDSETKELVVANGICCNKGEPSVKYPLITRRVKISYDPESDIIRLEDLDVLSELYTPVVQTLEDVNAEIIKQFKADLSQHDYHPLDRIDTPVFLKALTRSLASDSVFYEEEPTKSWTAKGRILVYLSPCLIYRKRLDGTVKTIEKIIEDISEKNTVPAPIQDIVSGGKTILPEKIEVESIEEQLAAVGGESVDILLAKEANKEQLEIAKRISQYNAVLVQGPPGTGKTHTIANLMGHFLAQGQSVLVTSQTTKALKVLKEKLPDGIKNLCVTVLEDSNADMEKSVDGITEYISKKTAAELFDEKESLLKERIDIIEQLAVTRRKIFQIINKECENVVYQGEGISPSAAARFILDNQNELSYIPGRVTKNEPMPLTYKELVSLYRSNAEVSTEDEKELELDLPNPNDLLHPVDFEAMQSKLKVCAERLNEVEEGFPWCIKVGENTEKIIFRKDGIEFEILAPQIETVSDMMSYASEFSGLEEWMFHAAIDGKNGEQFLEQWQLLIEQLEKTVEYAESLVSEKLGIDLKFVDDDNYAQYEKTFEKMRNIFSEKGKISKFTMMLNKDFAPALESVRLDDAPIKDANGCEIVLHEIALRKMRKKCASYWDALLGKHQVSLFMELSPSYPERIAARYIPLIQKALVWYTVEYPVLKNKLDSLEIPEEKLFEIDVLDSDLVALKKLVAVTKNELPVICEICSLVMEINSINKTLKKNESVLTARKRVNSPACSGLVAASSEGDCEKYKIAFADLSMMYSKYELRYLREDLLRKMQLVAPQWADAVKHRDGIHGQTEVPNRIEDAWKWKQLSIVIDELTSVSFSELQQKCSALSRKYRDVTALYAEKCAWYHMLERTEGDLDMRQALQGWKQTVKKIGKGTGKRAPMYKAEARRLMGKCQKAVPSWIMPINRALESLDPKKNKFDIVIIDEASQSDISSLAILYMGKKLIIVGDDKQVSPSGVGVEIDKVTKLQKMYISGKVKNAHLYDEKTSIYDIAKTTFQPLMLREHFRCVPDIIGFSNMLSYDGKIKALRETNSKDIMPAVVNYRVKDGKRDRSKSNTREAKTIVALMAACMEQPEYTGKTFGMISLLGEEQAKLVQTYVEKMIPRKEIAERNILCGDASHFQGDERDVIFLSMVDSRKEGSLGLMRIATFGVDDQTRKRYNVAASRAKDQLWVVNSIDAANDLKAGDIRKTLLDYASNPQAFRNRDDEIAQKADSPFEVAVVSALVNHGYHVEQQHQVGAYRLDMIVKYQSKSIAIECDGERYHSGEEKIREDMERQTILERVGWRFIRIRGSEYYSNPDKTITRVIRDLNNYGIFPEDARTSDGHLSDESALKSRVVQRAEIILKDFDNPENITDFDTIGAALMS